MNKLDDRTRVHNDLEKQVQNQEEFIINKKYLTSQIVLSWKGPAGIIKSNSWHRTPQESHHGVP